MPSLSSVSSPRIPFGALPREDYVSPIFRRSFRAASPRKMSPFYPFIVAPLRVAAPCKLVINPLFVGYLGNSRFAMLGRLFGYEGHEIEDREADPSQSKLQIPDLKAIRDGFGIPSIETIPCLLEPFLRRVVREEMDKIETRIFSSMESARRSPLCQIDGSTRCRWKLQFKNELPGTLYTASRIEADQNYAVQLAIVDATTNEIVTSGALASLKVDVVAINGDFCPDQQRDWTSQVFTSSILRQREGKPQLLAGDLVVTLDKGIGYLGNAYFTDNSSWIRSRKFRLGLRTQKCGSLVDRVQEGLSNAFLVKDHRGESYKKHHPPSPDDEVWRLEKIGKDGAFHRRLSEKKISTVRDFLKHLVVDQSVLRNIFGNGMSNKVWEATVQHAWECEIEKKPCYSYHSVESQVTLYFDTIYRVVGVDFKGYPYQSLNDLPADQKVLVDQLKELAYQNQASMTAISNFTPLWSSLAPNSQEGESHDAIGIGDWSSCSLELPGSSNQQKHNTNPQQYYPVPKDWYSSDNFGSFGCPYNGNSTYTGEWNESCPEGNSMGILHSYSSMGNLDLSHGLLRDAVDGPEAPTSPAACTGITPGRSKWFKLLTTLKCGMSIRKRVAAKRRARLAQISFQMYSHLPNNVCQRF